MIRPLTAIAALAGLLGGQAAQAAAPTQPCLNRAELTAIVTYALPVAMDSALAFCRPHLSPQGFFARDGQALIQRYAAAKPGAWPQARAALVKFAQAGNDQGLKAMARLSDNALQPFAEGMVGQIVTDGMKPRSCAPLEQAVRLLAPLPPENTAGLITFLITQIDKPGSPARKRDLPLCAAEQ